MPEVAETEKKQTYTWKVEFPMYSDYDRIFFLCKRADDLSIEVENLDFGKVREYYATLAGIYRNIKPILKDTTSKKELDEKFDSLEKRTFNIIKIISEGNLESITDYQIIKDLIELHQKLLVMKQFCGLGIMIRNSAIGLHKVENAMGLGND